MKRTEFIILLVILLTAIVFRFTDLHTVPLGIFADEAVNGNDAVRTLQSGSYDVFYEGNNGREGLFIWMEALAIRFFGHTQFALRVFPALIGVLTVLGTYFLTRILFEWRIAAISSFLLAASFWHTLFSRIGFRAILAPFLLTWGLYFLWRGMSRLSFSSYALAGVFWGLGFYTYIAFRAMPLVVILMLVAYWHAARKDFDRSAFRHMQTQLVRGIALFALIAFIIALPLLTHFYFNPGDIFGRTSQISIFSDGNPVRAIIQNAGLTFGMFTFIGDFNWRHNIAGEPLLNVFVGAMFVIGLFRSAWKLLRMKREHGHFSTVHTLLFSWFLVGLLPVIFSNEGMPHALRAIIVAPVVMIFAGEGMWWMFKMLEDWYHERDRHTVTVPHITPRKTLSESSIVGTLTIVALLIAICLSEQDRYFNRWADAPQVADAFHASALTVAQQARALSDTGPVYVIAGSLYDLEPVMFLTNTETTAKQRAGRIHYRTHDEYQAQGVPRGANVLFLNQP